MYGTRSLGASNHRGGASSDVPIIGNNRLINRKAVDYDDQFLIYNNRSSDACTKHAKFEELWSPARQQI